MKYEVYRIRHAGKKIQTRFILLVALTDGLVMSQGPEPEKEQTIGVDHDT